VGEALRPPRRELEGWPSWIAFCLLFQTYPHTLLPDILPL